MSVCCEKIDLQHPSISPKTPWHHLCTVCFVSLLLHQAYIGRAGLVEFQTKPSYLLARMIQSLTKLHRETGRWQGYSCRWCLMASLKAHKGWTHRLNRSGPQRGMIDGQDVCSTFTWKKCINTILSVLPVFRLEESWSQGKPQQGLSVQIS